MNIELDELNIGEKLVIREAFRNKAILSQHLIQGLFINLIHSMSGVQQSKTNRTIFVLNLIDKREQRKFWGC